MTPRAAIAGAALTLFIAAPALACPATRPCTTAPSILQIDLATAQWRQAEPATSVEVAQQPAAKLWSALRRRIEDRLPHRARHGRVLVVAPMIVTGVIDSVPGFVVGGAF
jgi:hypothetical protein